MPALFSLSKLRSRGRSVDSRRNAPRSASTNNKPSKNSMRSVSVPPQRSKTNKSVMSGNKSVMSAKSVVSGNKSVMSAASATVNSGSGSKSSRSSRDLRRADEMAMSTSTSLSGRKSSGQLTNSTASIAFAGNVSGQHSSLHHNSGHSHEHHGNQGGARYFPDTYIKSAYSSDDGNTSTDETSDEFMSSLDRSPHCRLEDVFLEEGVFGRTNNTYGNSSGGNVNYNERGPSDEFQDPPDIIPSLEDDEPDLDNDDLLDDRHNDAFSVHTDLTDPTAQWAAFDDEGNAADVQHQTTVNNQTSKQSVQQTAQLSVQQIQQQKKPQQSQEREWEPQPWRNKNPRLVSPSPSQKKNLKNAKCTQNNWTATAGDNEPMSPFSQGDEDLLAWGMHEEFNNDSANQAGAQNRGAAVQDKSAKAQDFGANFFTTGFDSKFGQDNDAFFGGGWNQTSDKNKNASSQDNAGQDNMMWEASPTFSEEKKDDQAWQSTPVATKKGTASSAARGTNAVPVTPQDHAWNLGPKSIDSPSKQDQEMVVSFDAFESGLNPTVSSSSSSRKMPPASPVFNGHANNGASASVKPQQKSHRRTPSNESAEFKIYQRSHSRNSRKPGGGSVGSNSSAVDQILESYRQKRLAKQQQAQQGAWPSSGSINSNQHQPPNSHKRTPSSESLSRTISNLEQSIAAKLTSNPSPTVTRASPTPQQQLPHQQSFNMSPKPSPGRASPQSSISYSRTSSNYQPNLNAAVNEISDRLRVHRSRGGVTDNNSTENPALESEQFLLANIEATIGPCGVAPDMESLSGRSNRSSLRGGRSSPKSHMRPRGDASVDSRTSRNSFRSYRSNISASALSHMSKESQSVANDLFRLEAQLAEVARQQDQPMDVIHTGQKSYSKNAYAENNRSNHGNVIIGAEPVPRPSLVEVVAPPGKLGILLSNKIGEKGPTHVSAVRSESVLAGKVHVGDRFVSIDGEDVSGMNSREITMIMGRKADVQRVIVFVPVQTQRAQDWI